MKTKLWWRGLFAAAIGGATGAASMIVVDPSHFNLFDGGARKLAEAMLSFAVISAVMYLKQHPLPEQDEINVMQLKRDQKDDGV